MCKSIFGQSTKASEKYRACSCGSDISFQFHMDRQNIEGTYEICVQGVSELREYDHLK